jgi:cathepsin A (carboxypeptidase C)
MLDFIVNGFGGKAWTNALDWSGAAGFQATAETNYTIAGEVAGTIQAFNGFSYIRVFEAGHLVPMDAPEAALAILNYAIHGVPLV